MNRRGFLGSMAALTASTGMSFKLLDAAETKSYAQECEDNGTGNWLVAEITGERAAEVRYIVMLRDPGEHLTEIEAVELEHDHGRVVIGFCLPAELFRGNRGTWHVQTKLVDPDGLALLSNQTEIQV